MSQKKLIVVVKQSCQTCQLVEPVLQQLQTQGLLSAVYSQDDPAFPADINCVVDDSDLHQSWQRNIEIVPTLIHLDGDREIERSEGWDRQQWAALAGVAELGAALPVSRPGCASKSIDPGMEEKLNIRFAGDGLEARRVALGEDEDEMEAMFNRGWSDGLPLVPPTPERVLRMLKGTCRAPHEIVGQVPPDLVNCTVEKVAVNAVMAGCKPEYMPVVLAAVEAALSEKFCMHGVLATTMFCGPIVIVNGPVTEAIGMNWSHNALGQGNRANAAIGRALQLLIRNVGGGKPGEIDRSALGSPGKYTFCFAEDETDSFWTPLAQERGATVGSSAVTVFAGEGVQGVVDQKARGPEALTASFAASLLAVSNIKSAMAGDAILVVCPEHVNVYREAGWDKARLHSELASRLMRDGEELIAGAHNIDEGLPAWVAGKQIPKFKPGGLMIVRAGGDAGKFSAILSGWGASGDVGSSPVTWELSE